MEIISKSDLFELVSVRGEHCVSMFFSNHLAGREGQQDAIRLKNLATFAEEQLIERGMRAPLAKKFINPVREIPYNESFWSSRKQGLAVFRSEDVFEVFRLEVPLEEVVFVDRCFHVKQLLPALDVYPPFHVLVLNRDKVRLLRSTWRGCESILPHNMPANMTKAMNLQGADRGEQVHSGRRGDLGKEAAVFHGQGGHRDTLKDEIGEYFRLVDNAIGPVLRESEWPLFLAGVDYELAIFREISTHTRFHDESLLGGFDYISDDAVCEQALPLGKNKPPR